MPRGKYVNHKGRSRHFTSPEELQQEVDESSEESSEEEEDENNEGEAGAAAAGTSKKLKSKPAKAATAAKKTNDSSEDEDSDEESDEESEDDRDARKGVASLIEIENPNRAVKKAAQKVSNIKLEDKDVKPELTRREREQIEKEKARQRYKKLHAAGKTSEAKADLARLALIRQQRAEAAAKREAEKKSGEEKKTGGSKA